MKILRVSDHRQMPWKNGKGTTTEIAVFPEGAGLDDFAWRVSMADVTEAGAFSVFEGIDRTLSVLDGEGIDLTVAGEAPVSLTVDSKPFAFPADAETQAGLVNGPIRDLNVMTRRGVYTHKVERGTLNTVDDLAFEAETTILLCRDGKLKLVSGGEKYVLEPGDAAVVPRDTRVDIGGNLKAAYFAIGFEPVPQD